MIHVDQADALELLDRTVAHIAIGERKRAELERELANERGLNAALKEKGETLDRLRPRLELAHGPCHDCGHGWLWHGSLPNCLHCTHEGCECKVWNDCGLVDSALKARAKRLDGVAFEIDRLLAGAVNIPAIPHDLREHLMRIKALALYAPAHGGAAP